MLVKEHVLERIEADLDQASLLYADDTEEETKEIAIEKIVELTVQPTPTVELIEEYAEEQKQVEAELQGGMPLAWELIQEQEQLEIDQAAKESEIRFEKMIAGQIVDEVLEEVSVTVADEPEDKKADTEADATEHIPDAENTNTLKPQLRVSIVDAEQV